MYPQHFHICAHVVILSLLHDPATRPCYMSPQCVLHTFLSLQHVAAPCPCNMTPRVSAPLVMLRNCWMKRVKYSHGFFIPVIRTGMKSWSIILCYVEHISFSEHVNICHDFEMTRNEDETQPGTVFVPG